MLSELAVGLLVGLFFAIFQAGPVGAGPQPKFGRKPVKERRKNKYVILLPFVHHSVLGWIYGWTLDFASLADRTENGHGTASESASRLNRG